MIERAQSYWARSTIDPDKINPNIASEIIIVDRNGFIGGVKELLSWLVKKKVYVYTRLALPKLL